MNPAPNLVFVGPMGAGKTSIGRRIAERLALAFVDADHRLEEITGASVPLIFECEGEAGFRAREKQLIAELCAGRDQLIATGGGAVLDADNRRSLREGGFVVYLQIDLERQLERLARDRQRPLLQQGGHSAQGRRERLEALAGQRGPLYDEIADLRFDAGQYGVERASERLLALLGERWQRGDASARKQADSA